MVSVKIRFDDMLCFPLNVPETPAKSGKIHLLFEGNLLIMLNVHWFRS